MTVLTRRLWIWFHFCSKLISSRDIPPDVKWSRVSKYAPLSGFWLFPKLYLYKTTAHWYSNWSRESHGSTQVTGFFYFLLLGLENWKSLRPDFVGVTNNAPLYPIRGITHPLMNENTWKIAKHFQKSLKGRGKLCPQRKKCPYYVKNRSKCQ